MRAATHFRSPLLASSLWLLPAAAVACPICDSPTGREVRAGIFGEDFGPNLLVTLLPFPIFLLVAAGLHFGYSPRGTADDPEVPGPTTRAR